jgi:regulator of protease activity HflC (stomatin/prohibitin superfamily)
MLSITLGVIGWIAVLWVMMSLKLFAPDEIAICYWFGKKWKIIGPGGWAWVPLGIADATVVSTHTNHVIVPGRKEQIERDDEKPLGAGQVRPVRVVHASKDNASYFWIETDPKDMKKGFVAKTPDELTDDEKKAMEDDSLQSSLTSEVIAFVDWNLQRDEEDAERTLKKQDERLFMFRENVGSVEAANKRIDGALRGALQDLLGPITLRNALNAKTHIQDLLKERIEILTGEEPETVEMPDGSTKKKYTEKPWGINVAAVQIEDINPGKRVNQARADEAAAINQRKTALENAEAEAKAEVLRADAAKVARMKDAEADAYERKMEGEGERDRLKAVVEIMDNDSARFLAQLEVARDVLPKSNFTVVPNDIGVIGGIVSLAHSMTNKKKESEEKK